MLSPDSKSVSGIYAIIRIGTSDCYVGQSVNIRKRWGAHRQDFKKNRHASKFMQRVFNKHGADVFEYRILETCPIADLIERETYWIEKLHPKYNSCPVAGSCFGLKHGPETSAKHRARMVGNKFALGKVSHMKGKHHSPETIAKIAAGHRGLPSKLKGIPRTEELKRKVSETKRLRGPTPAQIAYFNRGSRGMSFA